MPTKEQMPDLRYISPENNPCSKEHLLSMTCLAENKYDHASCKIYFENYKACKNFWNKVRNDRRLQRISPILPPPEEREKIKREYLESKK